jgi:hypothetical protein
MFLRPYGASASFRFSPTPYGVGFILALLRSFYSSPSPTPHGVRFILALVPSFFLYRQTLLGTPDAAPQFCFFVHRVASEPRSGVRIKPTAQAVGRFETSRQAP